MSGYYGSHKYDIRRSSKCVSEFAPLWIFFCLEHCNESSPKMSTSNTIIECRNRLSFVSRFNTVEQLSVTGHCESVILCWMAGIEHNGPLGSKWSKISPFSHTAGRNCWDRKGYLCMGMSKATLRYLRVLTARIV